MKKKEKNAQIITMRGKITKQRLPAFALQFWFSLTA
jgi:hypothetical protein